MRKNLLVLFFLGLLTISSAFAQTRSITGTVSGADDGATLPGVTVSIRGTAKGVVTDVGGKFMLAAKNGDVLQFSYVGFVTNYVTVKNGKSNYDVLLKTDTHLLNEVTVTDGYSVQQKKSYTGASTAVNGQRNENKPFTSTMQSLQGEVAGLNVTNNSGQPGANVEVRLRGVGSLGAGSNPLYVVDGTIITSGDLSSLTTTTNVLAGLNNDDILSINVLKDASATAIYGSRGANGVIIITTKRGKAGKTQVEADAELGTTANLPLQQAGKPLTASEYRTLLIEGLNNAGVDTATLNYYVNNYASGPSNNWYNLVTRNGSQKQYNVSVRGGSEDTKVFASGGYFQQIGTTIASSLTRVTGLVNIDHNINKRLSISLGLNVSNVNQYTPTNGGYFSNPIGSAYFLTPYQTAYNPNGTLNISQTTFPDGVSNFNPLYVAANDKHYLSQTRELGNFALKWNIISSLKFTSYVGIDNNALEENVYNNPIMGDGASVQGSGSDDYTRIFNYIFRQQFDYRYNIFKGNDDFYVDLIAGYEAQKSAGYYIQANSTGYPATQPLLTASVNASTPKVGNASFQDYSFDSYYSRASINYKNLYSLSATFRRDGSSKFGRNDPYANFYSIGGAWNIDEEAFFSKQNILSSAKIRSSFGTSGNAEGLANYGALPTAGYGNNYAGNNGQNFNTIGNPSLTWESSQKFDAGADIGFLKDRLVITVDYYHDNINKLIQNVPVSYITGFSSVTANIGAMLNRGFEIGITGVPVKTKDFRWETDINIALNKNTVTKLYNNQPYDAPGGFRAEVGKDINTWYMPAFAGVNPANGEMLWYTDASKKTTTNNYSDAARIAEYQADPKAFGGFTNTFTYKNFTLSADLYYNVGNRIYDSWGSYFFDGTYITGINKYQYVYDNRWTHPGQITDVPQYVAGGTNNGQAGNFSSRFLYNGDYVRLRNLTIGYNFSDINFLKSLGLSKLYLYGRGTNLFTKTYAKELPFDPEVGINGQSNLEVPQVRTFTVGLNVGF